VVQNTETWRRRTVLLSSALNLLTLFCSTPISAAPPDGPPPEVDMSVVLSAARPDYPYEARRARMQGTGVAVIEVDTETGRVRDVRMEPSTGHAMLDHAATQAFRQWRFKPGTVARARVPITFTIGGRPIFYLDVKQTPVDDVLARFLGKGTLLRGSFPEYPHPTQWTRKQGTGVYELHVQKDGSVGAVKVLQPSGDETFDRVTVKTLRKWRLRRGPVIIELPLSFKLTPTSYSVDIPRRR
jgi:TonB family protein